MVQKNRKYLKHVIENIKFCAEANIALRGHDESESSKNPGNFLRLVKLRSEELPILLEENNYKGHMSQDEILGLISSKILCLIKTEIGNKPFSIIIDETPDVTRFEQVSVVIRYVDGCLRIFERFIGFFKVHSTTGEHLFDLAKAIIKDLGLSAENNFVGQSFDGCSNMSGINKGVAARFRNISPRALFVHCRSHKLNLIQSFWCCSWSKNGIF